MPVAQQAEQMQVYWRVSGACKTCMFCILFRVLFLFQFIEGMLTNLGTLPLDRIQAMLKYAPGYDRTVEQLALFMEAARREGLVSVRDGIWKLNK